MLRYGPGLLILSMVDSQHEDKDGKYKFEPTPINVQRWDIIEGVVYFIAEDDDSIQFVPTWRIAAGDIRPGVFKDIVEKFRKATP